MDGDLLNINDYTDENIIKVVSHNDEAYDVNGFKNKITRFNTKMKRGNEFVETKFAIKVENFSIHKITDGEKDRYRVTCEMSSDSMKKLEMFDKNLNEACVEYMDFLEVKRIRDSQYKYVPIDNKNKEKFFSIYNKNEEESF